MKQTFTSASTSINKNKLPALYHKIDFAQFSAVLDWGCGKYNNGRDFAQSHFNVKWFGYDKYNRTEEENDTTTEVMNTMPSDKYCVISSNLLNVIDSEEEILDIAQIIRGTNTSYFISVYEGDRSGVGRQTGPDSYQRNEKINSYLLFFPDAVIKHGVLTNCPEAVI